MHIEEPVRKFAKKLTTSMHSAQWRLLNRNRKHFNDIKNGKIDWEYTWQSSIITKLTNRKTSGEESKLRSFGMKLLNNELPTLEVMKVKFPRVYHGDLECVRCNDGKEDINHIFGCDKNMIPLSVICSKFINTLKSKCSNKIEGKFADNFNKGIQEIFALSAPVNTQITYQHEVTIYDLIIGIIPKELTALVRNLAKNGNIAKEIFCETFISFRKFLHDAIWRTRCEEVIRWEKNNNIYKNDKKSKKQYKINNKNINNNNDNGNISSNSNNNNNSSNNINSNNNNNDGNNISCRNDRTLDIAIKKQFIDITFEHMYNVVRTGCNLFSIYNIGYSRTLTC
jgi:hypothetical protein